MALQSIAGVANHLLELAVGGVFALQVWMVKALVDVRSDTRVTRTTLFGETGQNGINGAVRDQGRDLGDLRERVAKLEP
jgi:hypothetical protein